MSYWDRRAIKLQKIVIKDLREENEKLQSELTALRSEWVSKIVKPLQPGWYATCNPGHKVSTPRYYDDSNDCWYIYSNHHDNYTLVPNNSFEIWTDMPKPPVEYIPPPDNRKPIPPPGGSE